MGQTRQWIQDVTGIQIGHKTLLIGQTHHIHWSHRKTLQEDIHSLHSLGALHWVTPFVAPLRSQDRGIHPEAFPWFREQSFWIDTVQSLATRGVGSQGGRGFGDPCHGCVLGLRAHRTPGMLPGQNCLPGRTSPRTDCRTEIQRTS